MPERHPPTDRPPVHVVVLDARRLVREGVRMLLAADDRLAVDAGPDAAFDTATAPATSSGVPSPVYVVGPGTPPPPGARCVVLDDAAGIAGLVERVLAAEPAGQVLDGSGAVPPSARPGADLTARERAVLRGVSVGRSAAEIGSDLGISARTVEWHKQSLTAKLGAATPARAVVLGHEQGLLQDVG